MSQDWGPAPPPEQHPPLVFFTVCLLVELIKMGRNKLPGPETIRCRADIQSRQPAVMAPMWERPPSFEPGPAD